MPTNLAIDDKLLRRALKLGGQPSKRETVDEALREYVAKRLRQRAPAAFGTITFDARWDYKKSRRTR